MDIEFKDTHCCVMSIETRNNWKREEKKERKKKTKEKKKEKETQSTEMAPSS